MGPDDETAAIAARRLSGKVTASGKFASLYSYIEILNLQDGSLIAKWPLDQEGIALSPKGRFLAVATVELAKGLGWQPTAHIYDIASSKAVATVVHDSVPEDKYLGTSLARGMSFTADGKYFVTSANNNVKIWKIDM